MENEKKAPELEDNSDDAILLCPGCGDTYLHHGEIEIFNRAEDAKKGLHIVANGETVRIDHDMAGCPSSRRQGIAVKVWCEGCSWESVLTIVQHKGQTVLSIVPKREVLEEELDKYI